MLKDPAVGKSPQMFQHISGVINDETKRLRFQVEKVLQMSMFERQKATLKMKEVNANELIEGVIHTFALKVEKYNAPLTAPFKIEDHDELPELDFEVTESDGDYRPIWMKTDDDGNASHEIKAQNRHEQRAVSRRRRK